MKYKCLSQEILKLIACLTMLLDHIGATILPSITLRIIGRIAFPIYCFLLAQGAAHTHSKAKYLLRLGIGILLAELPFDYLFSGGWDWGYQSVMVTLFLGAAMLFAMQKIQKPYLRPLLIIPFYILAELCKCDYCGTGILMIALFGLFQQWSLQALVLLMVNYLSDSYRIPLLGIRIPIQLFAVGAMIPIGMYSGKKMTRSPALQAAFYLFYPAHLTLLLIFAKYLL